MIDTRRCATFAVVVVAVVVAGVCAAAADGGGGGCCVVRLAFADNGLSVRDCDVDLLLSEVVVDDTASE